MSSSSSIASTAVVTWNCRSLLSKINCIKSFLHVSQPLVLALCETWPRVWQSRAPPVTATDSEHCLQVPGYSFVAIPVSAAATGNGGLAFYIRHGITFDVASYTRTAATVTQVAWLSLCLPQPVLLGVCYLHSSASDAELAAVHS